MCVFLNVLPVKVWFVRILCAVLENLSFSVLRRLKIFSLYARTKVRLRRKKFFALQDKKI